MNRGTLTITISLLVLCTIALCITLAARKVSGRNSEAQTSAQAYNPYPAGILPSDLNPESERVRPELRVLAGPALARWPPLKPRILAGETQHIRHPRPDAAGTLDRRTDA